MYLIDIKIVKVI